MKRIINYLSPFRCLLCNSALWRKYDLCERCEVSLSHCTQACQLCAAQLVESGICGVCMTKPPQFAAACSALWYEGEVASLVGQLKYQHHLSASRVMAQLMVKRVRSLQLPLPDIVVPVPLHPKRLRLRGFNQSALLAKDIATSLTLQWDATLLKRVVDTPPQVGLPEADRRRNVRNAFQVTRINPPPRILLIDDVMTTGATLNAIATIYPGEVTVAVCARVIR